MSAETRRIRRERKKRKTEDAARPLPYPGFGELDYLVLSRHEYEWIKACLDARKRESK